MTEPSSRSETPSLAPLRRPEDDHAPAISSPLNPNPDAGARARVRGGREQREKRETLKKREAASSIRAPTPNKSKAAPAPPATPSPTRFGIPPPKLADYEAPKDGLFASHEPHPFFTPDGQTELKKPVDQSVAPGCRCVHI